MATEAQKQAMERYRQKLKRFTVEFTEKDLALWEQLVNQPNKQGYIKTLIRADIERQTIK